MKLPNLNLLRLGERLLMIRVKKTRASRIKQGDIFKDIRYIKSYQEKRGVYEVDAINFPLVIVLTQDCDLEQEHNQRLKNIDAEEKNHNNYLLSILVAPLYNFEHFSGGEHLKDVDLEIVEPKMENFNTGSKSILKKIKQNELPRYHYMDFPKDIPIIPSVIDFKHYFSVDTEIIKKEKNKKFVCSVRELYREQISLRFANFLSRIGLP